MKRKFAVLLLGIMMMAIALAGTAGAQSSGGFSYWLTDGSCACSQLYFVPEGGGEAIFTGLYMDMNGEYFYYAK